MRAAVTAAPLRVGDRDWPCGRTTRPLARVESTAAWPDTASTTSALPSLATREVIQANRPASLATNGRISAAQGIPSWPWRHKIASRTSRLTQPDCLAISGWPCHAKLSQRPVAKKAADVGLHTA